jgi:lysophospholipase L1-like esterase
MVACSPLPLRVLVKGASTVSWTSWMGGPRTDLTFPRAIEAHLLSHGQSAEVRNRAVLGAPTRSFLERWEEEVLQWSPDAIVVCAGHYETIHLFLPHWFERHVNHPDRRPGPVRSFYHRRILRGLWKLLTRVQSNVDARLPSVGLLRRRLNRVARDLEGYISLSQQVGSPQFIILEVLPPAARQSGWFPGMTRRVELLNETMSALVDRIALPQVEYLKVSDVAARLYGDDLQLATPDGFHFTPELHRALGAELAGRILDRSRTHPPVAASTDDGG